MKAKHPITPSARRTAWRWLSAVLEDRLDLETAVPEDIDRLEPRDRAFARLLVLTALRRHGQIEDLLGRFLDTRPPAKARGVVPLLHLGIAQLAFLETAPHAAVSTSVDLAKTVAKGRFSGLVNAVLRRCDREATAISAAQDAARLNTPDWLWKSWSGAYGEARARAVAEAHLGEAPLDLSVRGDAEAWARRLGGKRVGPATVRLAAAGPVESLDGFEDGAWWVQDRAAAIPAALMGKVRDLRVLDLCAAPGGKTAQLAAVGARVTAVDRSESRMARLSENLTRLGLAAKTRVADALAADAVSGAPFDAVLLDAPCTATGTIRRHPDVAWRRSPDDVRAMAETQRTLLSRAATLVKPGGRVVYATCSLQPEEGAAVVDAALEAGTPLARDPLRSGEHGLDAAWITPAGDVRTLPCQLAEQGGMDGFFIARLFRRP